MSTASFARTSSRPSIERLENRTLLAAAPRTVYYADHRLDSPQA
jgi:hypothetical protein